jgi:hypothetical protein
MWDKSIKLAKHNLLIKRRVIIYGNEWTGI